MCLDDHLTFKHPIESVGVHVAFFYFIVDGITHSVDFHK